jgi:hypothetical protein
MAPTMAYRRSRIKEVLTYSLEHYTYVGSTHEMERGTDVQIQMS